MKNGDEFKFVRLDYSVVDVTVAEFYKEVGATFYHNGELYFCLHNKLSPEWKYIEKVQKPVNINLIEYISDSVDRHGMILEATWLSIIKKHTGLYIKKTRSYSEDECAFR